ncbi:MAG: metallophosphoesterase [Eubacteriales bacterium]|nr:metallophosphoesterase [Eubacteriales bacterium]
MVYVTGDIHADIEAFKNRGLRKLKKGDSLIVCGDFGFIWDGSKKEEKILKKIGKKKYNVLFMEGTHDNITKIRQYPLQDYCGGKARNITGNLYYLERGYVFNIDSKYIFAFGGGESNDTDCRQEGVSWWKEELPSQDEIEMAKENLEQYRNVVDYVVTHQCSGKIADFLYIDEFNRKNNLHYFLDYVMGNCRYKGWFFGKEHLDKAISPNTTAVFQKVLPLR